MLKSVWEALPFSSYQHPYATVASALTRLFLKSRFKSKRCLHFFCHAKYYECAHSLETVELEVLIHVTVLAFSGSPFSLSPSVQDLEYLSEGLEGRSSNPVAVLFDTLLHPDADFGYDYPSVLHWKLEQHHYIPHLVLGKGPPGGAWHVSMMFTR